MKNKPIHSVHFDHRHLYVNDEIFYPIVHTVENITESTNTILIYLDGKNHSLLNWEDKIRWAKILMEKGYYIYWEIDLGLATPNFPIRDEMYFLSSKIALTQFVEKILHPFRSSTLAVSLYRGGTPHFLHNEIKSNNTLQMNLLSDYLHLLAPFLPDDLVMTIFLDLSEISSQSELIHLTSKKRFEFFLLAVKGKELSYALGLQRANTMGAIETTRENIEIKSSNVGVCFTSYKDTEIFKNYDEIFTSLEQNNIDYRILPENFATEQWDELDYIIVVKKALSDLGLRMIRGFIAAGGIPISVDAPLEFENEISYHQFLDTYDEKKLCQ